MKTGRAHRSFFSFGRSSLIYFIISMVIVRIFPHPAVMIFVTSVSILLIPLVVGKSVITIFYKNHKNDYATFISSNVVEWLVGNLVIYFVAAILFTLGLLESYVFTFLIIVLPTAYLILSELRIRDKVQRSSMSESIKETFGNKFVIPLILLAGLLPLLYLIPIQPFPLSPTQTGGRLRLSLQFIDSGYIELVHGYSSLLSPIHSLTTISYDLHPLQVLSATAYVAHIVFPFALYLVSYKITKDSLISLVPAFIGPWFFLGGNMSLTAVENTNLLFQMFPWLLYVGIDRLSPFPISSKSFSKSYFLLSLAIIFLSPMTYLIGKGGSVIPPTCFIFLSIFLPVILIGIYYALNVKHTPRIGVLITYILPFTLIAIIHPYLGPLLITFLSAFYFAASVSEARTAKILRLTSVILTATVLILVFFGINGPDNFILSKFVFGDLLQGTGLDINIQQKWATFLEWGPAFAAYIYLILAFLIGIFGNRKNIPFVFASSIILFITFLPEGNFWRSQAYLNPIVAVMFAYVILVVWSLIDLHAGVLKSRFSSSLTEKANRAVAALKRSHVTPKLLFVAVILLILMPLVQVPRAKYLGDWVATSGEGYHSNFQTYDVTGSFWILNNFRNEKVLIISDPATMYYVGSLTAMDTLMTQYIDPYTPWEYGNETWNYMEQLKQDVFSLLGKEGSYSRVQGVASTIYPHIQDYSKIFFVITPHTYYWLYDNETFPTRVKIMPIDSSAIINDLENDNDFALVFEDSEVLYIYELEKK